MNVKVYSLAESGEKKISPNFRAREFRCRDGSDPIFVDEALLALLEAIRSHFNEPVNINSAFRTVAYNARGDVGGSPRSQHLYARAADIWLPGVPPLAVAQYAEFLQPTKGGIGVYKTFTHVDVRENRSRWDSRSGKQVVVSGWPGYKE